MAEHPPHFVKETPRREAPGVPFVEDVFPEHSLVVQRLCEANRRHWWHPTARRPFTGRPGRFRCCQCGVYRRWWQR